uniref:Uncharacterized protein n=1 Tax=Hyaloperonospora arabidopsidis (strain Emoy2) TaxID=559515 RepID=M4BVE1_HYAAE
MQPLKPLKLKQFPLLMFPLFRDYHNGRRCKTPMTKYQVTREPLLPISFLEEVSKGIETQVTD